MTNPFGNYLQHESDDKLIYAEQELSRINASKGMTGNAEMLHELASRLLSRVLEEKAGC